MAFDNLEFHEKLGEGGYGTVKRVTFKQPYKGYTEAAAKFVRDMRKEEVEIMSKLSHPNIVTWLGFTNEPISIIFLEIAKNGDLHSHLSDSSKPLPDTLKQKWIQDSVLALQYLHGQNFLHRDIKARNCLLFDPDTLKLCDFGLAREIDRSFTTSSTKGTYQYMAPEIHNTNVNNRAVYSKSSEIYALGMLVQEIWTRKPPFHGLPYGQVIYQVGEGKLQPEIASDCPEDLANMMKQCWDVNPRKRPSIDAIYEGKYKYPDNRQ